MCDGLGTIAEYFFPWPISHHFARFAMILLGLRSLRLQPSLTTRLLPKCRTDTTPPAHTISSVLFWASGVPMTALLTILIPAPLLPFGIGGQKGCFSKTPSLPFIATRSDSQCRART